ncbi:MAG: signal peptidase I [Anaerolineaceae bacterium]
MKRLFNFKTASAAISFVTLILIWILFAPIQVGGQSYYVIINGNSMEPLFHKGDLVILRASDEYQVGDIVAYKYPGLGNVFHRIINIDSGIFQMKGDNNSWVDAYTPNNGEIVAKYWFSIKKIGNYIGIIKSPWIIALITGIFCVIMGLSMVTQSNEKKNKQKRGILTKLSYKIADWRNGYWWTVYTIGVLAIILGIFAYTRPILRTVKEMIPYNQKGDFSYNGNVGQSVYDTRDVQTGDPIFTTLGCDLNFLFDYSLTSNELFTGGGTYEITALLQANNGWKRSFVLTPENQFSGNSFHSESKMNICNLQTIIKNTQIITQVENLQYSLIITPTVKVSGLLAGIGLEDSFTPQLSFNVDPLQVYLPTNYDTEHDPIHPTISANVEKSVVELNTLPIFSNQLPVWLARYISITLLVLAMLGIFIPTAIFGMASKKDKKLQAKLLVGSMLVETQISPVSGNERIVDVTSFEDLAILSERTNSTVFFHQQPLYTDYLVRDNALVYRFRQIVLLPEGKERSSFQNMLIRAIKNQEFVLFYQPIYSLQDGTIAQVEALLRWQHPQKGLLMAGDFLPYAEKSDLICLIDNWVLQKACEQLREWKDQGLLQFTLAINISIQQLRDPVLAKNIEDALLENQLPADCLSIEISLDQLVFDASVMNNLKRIRQLGVNITVKSGDDNAISKFHQLDEVDQLKISQNLVRQVISNPSSGTATRNIIEAAHRKKVGVTAVGVETNEEMGFFRLNACDGIQGNMLSRPLPFGEFNKILKNKKAGSN